MSSVDYSFQLQFPGVREEKYSYIGKIKNIDHSNVWGFWLNCLQKRQNEILCHQEGLEHYNIKFNFTMNLFDDLEAELNENSLDVILGLSSPASEPNDHVAELLNQCLEKPNCVTYQWFWNDVEPMQEATPVTQDTAIDEMKSARAEQEEKVKRFIANIKPLTIIQRKASIQAQTEAGSPKKKKIRKMLSFK